MSDNFEDQKVLDTLKFKDGRIFLRDQHVQRSFEACALLNPKLNLQDMMETYALIEKQYQLITSKSQILRILLTVTSKIDFKVEVLEKLELPDTLKLQLIAKPLQPAGTGVQNYKWDHRPFWTELMKNKKPEADDVIAINTRGEITETSRGNLFLYAADKKTVFTPPLESGCIHGVYRRYVLQNGKIMLPNLGLKTVKELSVGYKDLPRYQIYMANSVREVVKAVLL